MLEARSHPFQTARIRHSGEIPEGYARGAKNEEQFAGPEQNVEQTRALEIREILRVQTDFESFLRTLFDESAHGGEVHALFVGFLTARIQSLQLRVTAEKKMVQAKSLVIERSSCGARTSTLATVAFRKFPIHRTHTS